MNLRLVEKDDVLLVAELWSNAQYMGEALCVYLREDPPTNKLQLMVKIKVELRKLLKSI